PVRLSDNRIANPGQGQSELVRRTSGRRPRRGLLPPRSGTTVASRCRRPRTRTGERRHLGGTSMGILKRSSSAICAALVALVAAGTAQAQDYPTRPVRIISGFGPGSAGDMLARIVSQKLSSALGQQFI